MTTDAPQWRPLSDAPSIIGAACVWLGPPYHASASALDAALQSGQVRARGSCLSRPLQQPIESYLSGANLDFAYVHLNEIKGLRGNDRLEFWNVEIDRTSLTQYVREFLAPAAARPDEPEAGPPPAGYAQSVGAAVWSRWQDKFQMPELDDRLAPASSCGRKPVDKAIHDALNHLREKEPTWPFNHAKADQKQIESLGGERWGFNILSLSAPLEKEKFA